MADNGSSYNKDSLLIKAPKKSHLPSRLVVLVFVMVCGVYICSISLKQSSLAIKTKHLNMKVITNLHHQQQQQCKVPDETERTEIPYIHFPFPKTFNREECECNPVRLFAILSMQRSGSGWFETLLNSHINVSSNGEIMGAKNRRANSSSILNVMDQVYSLDWVSSASKNECSAAVGFKWMLNQGVMVHHEAISEYFNRKGVSAIFLFRRNSLRRMISMLANSHDKSTKTLERPHKSHVHSLEEAKILANYKPTVNTSVLIHELKKVEERERRVIEYFNTTRHIVVYYEDIFGNQRKLREIQEFLRLPYRELRSTQVKIHKGPLSNHIMNWDEVQKAIQGTSYERFLHSDY